MSVPPQFRPLRCEPLEDRRLLAVFLVNDTGDTVDVNLGDGLAEDASGNTTLRAAIMEANALAGDDAITLPVGTYTLSLAGRDDDTGAVGDLDVNDTTGSLTITGNGAATTIIDAAQIDRVFHVLADANLELSGVTVTGGSSTSAGGGIYNAGTLMLSALSVSGNSTTNSGGGVYDYYGDLTLAGCLVTGNTATGDGGGIYNNFGLSTIIDSTISGNNARRGGGVWVSSPYSYTIKVALENSILWGNVATDSNGGNDIGFYNGAASASHSIYGNGGFADLGGNISGDPLFVDAPAGDYRLQLNSPAIDSGDDTLVPATLTTDLDGSMRIRGAAVDIGVYEHAAVTRDAPSLVVDTTGDGFDFSDGATTLREAIHYIESDKIAGDAITFAPSLDGSAILLDSALTDYASLTIDASDLDLTIDAQGNDRVLYLGNDGTTDLDVTLIGLTLTGGQTTTSGGAIYNDNQNLTLVGCLVTGNTATGDGGGIYNRFGMSTIVSSTISGNTAGSRGGGIFVHSPYSYTIKVALENSILWGNVATDSNGGNDIGFYNGAASASHSIYGNGGFADLGGNISGDPLFVDAPAGDYRLQLNSPAIDSGDDTLVPATLTTDLDGSMRIRGAAVDIGVYEHAAVTRDAPSLVVDTTGDGFDFSGRCDHAPRSDPLH